MTLAYTQTLALCGLQAHLVRVEADLSGGLPQFNILGLAAQAARESRDRIRVAVQNLGFGFPAGRVTVQITSPVALESPGLADLAIAVALLQAMRRLPPERLAGQVFLGQLSLSGALLPLEQGPSWTRAARRLGCRLVVPRGTSAYSLSSVTPEASPAWTSVSSLADLLACALGKAAFEPLVDEAPAMPAPGRIALPDPSAWDEVQGQPQAKRAAVVALAGGHHLLMLGPPGVGKSMIAHRMALLQPPMSVEDEQELTAIRALTPDLSVTPVGGAAPFRAPHHTASASALFGGGRPFRPGEISLAHGGILFLDELAEFRRDALEALREPLETGAVQTARLQTRFVMPARTQLVAAMNPCPCGLFGLVRGNSTPCRCSARQVQAYRSKLSAPLLDRFDLVVLMGARPPKSGSVPLEPDWTGAAAQAAIVRARQRARARQGVLNAQLPESLLMRLPMTSCATSLGDQLERQPDLSRRALSRIRRVAQTIADLADFAVVDSACLAQAVEMRRGLALQEQAIA